MDSWQLRPEALQISIWAENLASVVYFYAETVSDVRRNGKLKRKFETTLCSAQVISVIFQSAVILRQTPTSDKQINKF